MRHNRKPALLRHFERHVEWCSSRSPAGVAPDPHLDASDQIAVGIDDAHAFAQVEQPQIGAFADHHARAEGEDAGKGNVEEGDDAQRRWLDHMAAKTVEIAGPGAAGIDESRRSAPPRHFSRIDTERGPAPIDMRMEIDQPGYHEEPAHIDDFGTVIREIVPDPGHFSVAKSDVGRLVATARRIDDAATSQDQICHMHDSGKIGWRDKAAVGPFE
jgi:hypothetical protein